MMSNNVKTVIPGRINHVDATCSDLKVFVISDVIGGEITI